MAIELSKEQNIKLVALMLIDSLLDESLENFLGEDILDELINAEIDIDDSKKKMIKDIIDINNLTREDLVGRKLSGGLSSYLNVVMK